MIGVYHVFPIWCYNFIIPSQYAYGRPPYGYKKDATVRKLIVDGETAPIVKRIFEMYLNGIIYSEIARELQQEGIVLPPKYRYLKQGNREKAEKARNWYHLHIKTILTNRHYVGDSVHATREGGFNNPYRDRRHGSRDKKYHQYDVQP